MSARITCLLLLFLVAYPLAAQDGSQSTHLKFSIVFADGVQPTFDRLDGRKPASVDESKREASFLLGDKQFYKGHYNDAARNYNQALTYFNRFSPPQGSELVAITQSKDIDAFKIRQSISKLRPAIEVIMAGVDLTKLTQEDIWNLTEGLHTFGILFQTRGNYVMADRIFNQALKIRGEKIGKTSEPYVSTLHSIAVLRKDQGKYAASEEIFKYLFKYYEKLKGKTSREYAIVLNNKAMLDATLGRTKDAVRQLEEILAMGSGVFLAEGIDLERVQANRALLAKESGDYVLATSILQKAIDNVVAKEMDDHPDYYDMVVMLGDLYLRQGRAATDMSQFEKALQKVKSRYGEDNIIYSKTLEILAEVQLRDKKFVEAKTSFARILQIRGSVLGTKHKDYLSALIRLGICEWKSMDLNSAELHFMQATEGYFFLVEELFPSMSETEKTNFWGMLKLQVDIFQSFTLENYRQKPDLLKRFYDLQIKTKGLLLNNANQVRNSILASADSEAIKLYNAWITAKELLSTYYRAR